MTSTARLVALALSGLFALGGPAYVGGQEPGPGTGAEAGEPVGPGSSVPFVAQGPLLCGGAAAAMVERFWGALGVYAEDYAHRVRPEEGGIRTGELVATLEERGHEVRVLSGDPARALEQVRARLPVLALVESGESRYHYVVLVAVGPREVRVHDPLRGPGRAWDREEFMARWAATGHWAAVALPAFSGDEAPAGGGGAEVESTPPLPEELAGALEALRAGDVEVARSVVERWLREAASDSPHRGTAWEMLASARYLAGDSRGALAAWNRVGLPPVDLVRTEGLRTLGWRPVVGPLGIEARDTLTPGALALAERRLLQLPAVRLGGVAYRPLRDGSVEVGVAVLERDPSPLGVVELAGTALAGLVSRRANVSFGPFLAVGERWSVGGSWEEARPGVWGRASLPWVPASAVVTLEAGRMEERFSANRPDGPSPEWNRTWGTARLERWMGPALRLGVTAGLERWERLGRVGRLGVSALGVVGSDAVRLGVEADGWTGSGAGWTRVRGAARYRHAPTARRAWTLTVGATASSGGSPPLLWDGAGTGRVRAPLLRGHRLVVDDRLGGVGLGRALLHGTAEHAWTLPAGPGGLSAALFVDAARVWDPWGDGGTRSYADPGVELSVSDGDRTVAVSLARGGAEWVLSARAGSATLPWLSVR